MEARHGPALSERERRVLAGIEEVLREDRALEQELRSMRLRGLHWLHRLHRGRRRRADGSGRAGGGAGT